MEIGVLIFLTFCSLATLDITSQCLGLTVSRKLIHSIDLGGRAPVHESQPSTNIISLFQHDHLESVPNAPGMSSKNYIGLVMIVPLGEPDLQLQSHPDFWYYAQASAVLQLRPAVAQH